MDCTLGLGGHAEAVLEAGAARVLGIDRDPHALALARERLARFGDRVTFVHADYRELPRILREVAIDRVRGILVDLGVSSMQLDDPQRGFSFRHAGPLDMRMNPAAGPSLRDRLSNVDERELADVIWQFGEERHSRRVARSIVAARDRGELLDTAALASAVRRAAGGGRWQALDPATRTFQALRIWVNDELTGLEAFIEAACSALEPGGRLVMIAFHSLEDRAVKHTMRRLAGDAAVARLVARRPVIASDEECARNPRARSARVRALERVA